MTSDGAVQPGQEAIVTLEGGLLKEFRPVDTKFGSYLRVTVELPLAEAKAADVLPTLWRMRGKLGLRAILVHDELQGVLPGFDEGSGQEDDAEPAPRRVHYVLTG